MDQPKQTIQFEPLEGYRFLSVSATNLIRGFFALYLLFIVVLSNNGILPEAAKPELALIIFCIAIVVPVYPIVRWFNRRARNKLQSFAAANGFSYIPTLEVKNEPGSLLNIGDSREAHYIINGTLGDLPFATYEYRYVVGSGKRRNDYRAMIFEITLPRVLPQFVIDSELENVLPITFDKSQKIELEGDFYKYFDLYAPDSYGVSALMLLAPDAMQVLIEHAALCDVEIVQNKLYFYWPKPPKNKQQYMQLFETAQAVIDKLGKRLVEVDIFASNAQAQIHADPNSRGVRLRGKRGVLIMTFALINVYFYSLFQTNNTVMTFYQSGILLFFVLSIAYFIWKQLRRIRSKRKYLAYRKNLL